MTSTLLTLYLLPILYEWGARRAIGVHLDEPKDLGDLEAVRAK